MEDYVKKISLSHQELATGRTNTRLFLLTDQVSSATTLNPPGRERELPDNINPLQYHISQQPSVGDIAHRLPEFKTMHRNNPSRKLPV